MHLLQMAYGQTEEMVEDQLGASYDELEWAMNKYSVSTKNEFKGRQEVFDIFIKLHNANLHKMKSIPVCMIQKNFNDMIHKKID